jgi:hypothetical protein
MDKYIEIEIDEIGNNYGIYIGYCRPEFKFGIATSMKIFKMLLTEKQRNDFFADGTNRFKILKRKFEEAKQEVESNPNSY